MVLKIIWLRKLLEGLSNRMESIKHHTIWLRAIVGVMYFLLFTGLLSSSLFVAKLHLEVGEPSPQLITAPRNKDIEDTQGIDKQSQELIGEQEQPQYGFDPSQAGPYTQAPRSDYYTQPATERR